MSDIYDPLSLPQIIGYIATIFGVWGLQQRDDNKMRIFICIMSGFIVTHFILMGAFSAAVAAGIAASRWILSIFTKVKKYRSSIVPIYIGLFLFAGSLTAEHWYHWLPIIASISGSYALFYCEKLKLRAVLLFGGSLWCIHNYFNMSYGPLAMEGIMVLSNLLMIYRFIVENKKLPRDPKDSFLSRFG